MPINDHDRDTGAEPRKAWNTPDVILGELSDSEKTGAPFDLAVMIGQTTGPS